MRYRSSLPDTCALSLESSLDFSGLREEEYISFNVTFQNFTISLFQIYRLCDCIPETLSFPQIVLLRWAKLSEAGAFLRIQFPIQLKWVHPLRSRHLMPQSSLALSIKAMSLTFPATKSQFFC